MLVIYEHSYFGPKNAFSLNVFLGPIGPVLTSFLICQKPTLRAGFISYDSHSVTRDTQFWYKNLWMSHARRLSVASHSKIAQC